MVDAARANMVLCPGPVGAVARDSCTEQVRPIRMKRTFDVNQVANPANCARPRVFGAGLAWQVDTNSLMSIPTAHKAYSTRRLCESPT